MGIKVEFKNLPKKTKTKKKPVKKTYAKKK